MTDKTFYTTKEIMLKKFFLCLMVTLGIPLYCLIIFSFLTTGDFFTLMQKDYLPITDQLEIFAFAIIASVAICWNQSHIIFHHKMTSLDEQPTCKNDDFDGIYFLGNFRIYYHLIQNITVRATLEGTELQIKHENWYFNNHMQTTTIYPKNYGTTAEEMLKYFPDHIPVIYK